MRVDNRTDASSHPNSAAAADLIENGYRIFRNVLTKDQVTELRACLQAYFARSGGYSYGGRTERRGMHAMETVAEVVCSAPILSLMRECTSPKAPVLTGECFIAMNTLARWHKDVTEQMGLGKGIYADPDFRVYKIAIYLQDQHETDPEVFKVVPGSHQHPEPVCVPVQPLSVRAGDVIVFDIRIDHAGHLPNVGRRLGHRLAKGVGACTRLDPEMLFAKARKAIASIGQKQSDRMGIFLTFGPAAPCTAAFETGLEVYSPSAMGIGDRHERPLNAEVQRALREQLVEMIRP